MAARLTTLSINAVKRQILLPSKAKAVKPMVQQRTVFTETGAICPKPEITRLGVLKVMALIIPCMTLGGYISREFASLLEEHDIFFPDDDD
ncbi:hypothetical protein LOTGIDRAFT_149539, partial [Lottia gigantea]